MKTAKTQTVIPLMVVLSLSAIAQQTAKVSAPVGAEIFVPVVANNPLSVSVETGRLDPEPNCKKDVDGCFPKIWASTREFPLGSQIWIKITVVNHSADLIANEYFYDGIPAVSVDVVEAATGLKPALTRAGCRERAGTRPDECPPLLDPRELSGSGGFLDIPPGKSATWTEEVTHKGSIPSQCRLKDSTS